MGNRSTAAAKSLLAVIVGVLSATVFASSAAAHNSLAGSNPKNDSVVERVPEQMTLTFLSAVNQKTLRIGVTGPDGVTRSDVDASVSGKIVTVPLESGPAGRYTVAYQLGSDDGHPVKGTIAFTARTGESTAPSPLASPSEPVAPTTTTPPVALNPVADADDPPRWPYLVGLLVLVLLLAAGVARVVRGSRARRR